MNNNVKNNKLITEFMGNKVFEAYWSNPTEKYCVDTKNLLIETGSGSIGLSKLQYDIDWNWLMNVIKQIENLGYNTLISNFQIQISDSKQQTDILISNIFINNTEKTKLKAVYKAVIEFIKWYNSKQ